MNKRKFRHRLLSIVLAMLMVVGMLPTSGLVTAKAATKNTTVYFDSSGNSAASWSSDTQIYVYGYNSTDDNIGEIKPMELIPGTTIYYYDLKKQYNYVVFLNTNSWPQGKDYSSRTEENLTIPWTTYTNPLFTLDGSYVQNGGYKKGGWSNYSSTTSGTFYVDADLVDYYNDARVDNAQYGILEKNNQGDVMGDAGENKGVAFSYLNQKISDAYGTISGNIPLYFGSLLFVNNRVGRASVGAPGYVSLKLWNSTANVALTVKGQNDNNVSTASHNTDASVRGLVYDELGENGELLALDGKTELPYFSESIAKNWTVTDANGNNGKSLMKYYADYKFPFKVTTYEDSNVKKYSYDSETDYAVYASSNTNDKKLKASNSHTKNVTKDSNDNEVNGYFPFNTPGETERANVNYGFGTKFTIPFTVNKNGTINGKEDGEAITFNFTGDDDVWVFLDGKLVLDMGGAHGKATGSIDFKNLTVTIEDSCEVSANETISGDSDVTGSYSGFTNWLWGVGCPSDNNTTNAYAQERSAVETGEYTATFESLHDKDFADTFKDSDKTHTLVMFYMERGMYDSNMKIEFTINPLPSGLSLSKTLDTTDVNAGLKDAVQLVDTNDFNFEIQTKDLTDAESAYGPVSDLHYSLNNYENKDTSTEATYEYNEEDDTLTKTLITGIGTRSFAHTFVNGSGSDRFVGGTGFHITEQTNTNTILKYDYTKTQWTVYDKKNNYSIIAQTNNKTNTENESCTNPLVAAFYMGSSNSTEFDTYDYYVNFKNTPIVSDLALEKEWIGNTTSPESFTFTVLLDLNGGTDYEPYKLAFTSSNTGRTALETTEDGVVTVAPGEKITFNGIPVNATYKIVETAPEKTGSWKLSNITLGTGTSATTDTDNYAVTGKILEEKTGVENAVKFINTDDSLSVSKVIYVEAGQPTTYAGSGVDKTSFTVTGKSKGITVTTKGKDADDNEITVEPIFTASEANKTYTVDYKGSKDGVNYTGTITVYTFKAADRVYVFDYGLDSNLADTTYGNGLFQKGVFFNDAAENTKNNAEESKYSTTAALSDIIQEETSDGSHQTTIAQKNSVKITDRTGNADQAVTCSINSFLDRVETYKYQVNIKRNISTVTSLDVNNPETGTVVTGSIKIMPANVVYYEDNFDSIVYTEKGGTIAESDETNSTQTNDITSVHGNDIVYNGSNNDSDGTTTALTRTDDGVPTFSFTFNGTGFDIVGRTSTDSAKLTIVVEDANGNVVKTGVVDTYYANGNLYQIPVISIKGLDSAKYTVKVAVVKSAKGGSIFYLDGIRIYNPMSDTSAYPDEKEKNVAFANIHQLLVGKGTISEDRYDDGTILSVTADDSKMVLVSYDADKKKAVLYGDTNTEDQGNKGSSTYSASLVDYLNKGPNNEVYLDPNVGIAFDVKGTDVRTIQVEAKKIDITLNEDPKTDAENSFSLMKADGTLVSLEKVESKTAMYYNIPVSYCISIDGGYRVILVAHDTVSLSNLKYTEECEVSVPETTDYLTRPEVYPTDDGYEYQAQIEKISFYPSAKALKAEKRVKITVTLDDATDFDHFVAYLVPDIKSVNTDSDEYMVELIRDSDTDLTYRFYAPELKGKYNFILIPVDKGDNRSCYQKSVAVKVK